MASLLRVRNIQGNLERVSYLRQKTKNKHFNIKINPKLKEIIESYLGDDYEVDDFIFPILKKSDPEHRYHDITTYKPKKLNRRLTEIATQAKIPPFTIYTARHTYAMALKRHGTPTNVIQDSLGHRTEEILKTRAI